MLDNEFVKENKLSERKETYFNLLKYKNVYIKRRNCCWRGTQIPFSLRQKKKSHHERNVVRKPFKENGKHDLL